MAFLSLAVHAADRKDRLDGFEGVDRAAPVVTKAPIVQPPLPNRNGRGVFVPPDRALPSGGFSKFVPGNLFQPRREPTDLSLGNADLESVTPCGDEFPVGAVCTRLSVSCPGLAQDEVIVAVTEPAGTASATVMLHNGSGGTTLFDNGFPAALLDRGIRVVQIVWVTDWPDPAGAKTSACRPATVFQWVFDNVHGDDRTRGFCALGHSGGSAALAYSLSFFGLSDVFDFVLLNSGPPMGRIDYGCEPSLYTGGPRFVCPAIPDPPIAYESSRWEEINRIEATVTCGDPYGDSSPVEQARWEADSVVSTGGLYDYPDTDLSYYFCSADPNSAIGLGSFYIDAVTSSQSVNCVGGECTGESTWKDPAAFDQMVDDIDSSCRPNHLTAR